MPDNEGLVLAIGPDEKLEKLIENLMR